MIKSKIIDNIKRNRISTTEVADCLDKSGCIADAKPLNRGHFRVGPVYWCYAYNNSNWELHEQIEHVDEGSVVIMEMIDCGDRAPIGSLVAKFLLLYRQVAAIVVMGPVRDAPHLIKENWPIWCRGVTPIGCFNTRNVLALDAARITAARAHYEGAVAVCDDSGVVVVPENKLDNDLLSKLHGIEEQEDIWFDCIDRRKWSTFETVCLKRYLNEGDEP